MCLGRITKKIKNPTNDIVTVWKAFDTDSELKVLLSFYQFDNFETEVGHWLKAHETQVMAGDSQYYTTGFHAFRHINQAKSAVDNYGDDTILLPVEFRYVTVHGIDHGIQTLVAKEMRIPRYWKKKAIRL
jgi:hypothetical protein